MRKNNSSRNKKAKKKAAPTSAQNLKGVNDGVSENIATTTEMAQVNSSSASAAVAARPRIGIFTFIRQVRAEMPKVSWPTRNETVVTTIMVFVMVAIAAIFFLLADQLLSFMVAWVLGAR